MASRISVVVLAGCTAGAPPGGAWSETVEAPADTQEVVATASAKPECERVRAGGIIHWHAGDLQCSGIDAMGCAFPFETPPRIEVAYRASAWDSSLAHELCHICGYLDESEADACSYRALRHRPPAPPAEPFAAAGPGPAPQITAMTATRAWHTMTVLPTGKVLVAGGFSKAREDTYVDLDSAELYDPATGMWSPTGSMTAPRYGHAAVLLPSGRVLIVGGARMYPSFVHTTTEIYDPETGTFTGTGSMHTPRVGPTVLLPSGQVLAVGGIQVPDTQIFSRAAELYDPQTGAWTATGSLVKERYLTHTAILLPSGDALVVGGTSFEGSREATATAELFSEATGSFRSTASLDYPVTEASAAPLPGGDVLLVGGCVGGRDVFGSCSSDDVPVRIYDGGWRDAAPLGWGRETAAALPLASGKVLVVGGTQFSDGGVWAELYDPASRSWSSSTPLRHDHGDGAAAAVLPGGDVLIAGGELTTFAETSRVPEPATISVAERFTPAP